MASKDEDRKSPAERAQEHAEQVASILIEQLERGTAPWQRPWDVSTSGMPLNATTGKAYRGTNAMYLWAASIKNGWDDPRWCTFRQAQSLEAQVRKGEHGYKIAFPATHFEVNKKDANGKPVLDANGQPVKVFVKYDQPRMKYYTVFSAHQIDGLPPLETRAKHAWDQDERAESILRGSGAKISHGGNSAYYTPSLDAITLPHREQFSSPDRYYATALHELGHWTGHDSRLARDLSGGYGSESYAREELRAEISSLMTGMELGLGHDPDQHAAYVAHWVQMLRDDPKEILRACSDATRISDYVLGFDHERSREHEHERETEEVREAERSAEPVAAMSIPTFEPHIPKDERYSFEGPGAAFAVTKGSRRIETWGSDHPALGIYGTSQGDGTTLRFDQRDTAWSAIRDAVAGKGNMDAIVNGSLRNGNETDRHAELRLQIARTVTNEILVSMTPTLEPERAAKIQLTREAADNLARAMDETESRQRKAHVVDALRGSVMEVEYERSRS